MHLSRFIVLAAVHIGSAFAGEAVKVSPDRFSYSAGKDKASVTAESCSSNGEMAASGTGSIGGVKIQYNCLNTGTFENSDFAIICGTRGGNSKDVACQAFYKNPYQAWCHVRMSSRANVAEPRKIVPTPASLRVCATLSGEFSGFKAGIT